jgi:hypothetical protein
MSGNIHKIVPRQICSLSNNQKLLLTQSEILSSSVATVLAVKLVRDENINVSGISLVGTTIKIDQITFEPEFRNTYAT